MSIAEDTWPIPWQPIVGDKKGMAPWLESIGARSALATLRTLPQGARDAWCASTARMLRRLDRRHADAARRFLTTALGPLDADELEDRVLQAFRHFLRVLIEADIVARMSNEERHERIRIEGAERVRPIQEAGTGALVVTCHLGNWEVAASAVPMVGFVPTYAVGKPPKNHYLAQQIQALREKNGVRLLPRRGAMEAAPAILRAGGTLGLLLDQRARVRPVLAPFFGRPARCDRSAGVLIRRMKVPLVFVFATCRDEPLTWDFRVDEILTPEELSQKSPQELAGIVNGVYERAIRRHPEQYFLLHDRYKDTPEADE